MNVSLGVDLGGSWLRAQAAAKDGRLLAKLRLPAVSWRRLPEVFPSLLRRLRIKRSERLVLGASGVWTASAKEEARCLLKPFASSIRVVSDLELAHAAAFAGGPGILVVAGTGSAAYAVDATGRKARAGGLGPLLGDEGSGFWLGRAALFNPDLCRRLALNPLEIAHNKNPVRRLAGLAPKILRLSSGKPAHAAARALRDEAAEFLADLAFQTLKSLRFAEGVPVSWTGGLLNDEGLRRRFLLLLQNRSETFRPAAPLLKPETAAAVLDAGLFL